MQIYIFLHVTAVFPPCTLLADHKTLHLDITHTFIQMNGNFCIPALLLALFSITTAAQKVTYRAGFFGFMDNREYFNPYVNDQTIFGSRLSGELGLALNDSNRIAGGLDFLYEFGSKGEWQQPDPILYYASEHRNLDFYMGAFPRLNLLKMPMALMIDTFQYFRPNMEGFFLRYKAETFTHNVWIDWTGRQSYQRRESFMLGFSGFFHKGVFTWQHHFVMSHLAHSLSVEPEIHLRDNGGYSAMAGLDLSRLTPFDSLTFSTGILGSWDRIRSVYDIRFPVGWVAEAEACYRGGGLHGMMYSGDNQYIVSGDGFYRSSFYSRIDAYYLVTRPLIEGRLQFSMHLIPGTVDLSMSLTVRVKIDGKFLRYQPS